MHRDRKGDMPAFPSSVMLLTSKVNCADCSATSRSPRKTTDWALETLVWHRSAHEDALEVVDQIVVIDKWIMSESNVK